MTRKKFMAIKRMKSLARLAKRRRSVRPWEEWLGRDVRGEVTLAQFLQRRRA